MVAPLTLHKGLTLGKGITFGAGTGGGGGGPAPGDITITYNEFTFGGGGPLYFNFEDPVATYNSTGFVTTTPNKAGVLMNGLTTPNLAFVSANLPDGFPGNGEIWTAHWSAGSTYSTTPVAIYYGSYGPGGTPCIVFYTLDPADNTYHTGTVGTFNFPMTLTAGTTTTSFMP
jgi:hypothetical protein